ncbi:cobalt ECF transporter T component CbiQ, partial [bacterium]|nr:cobalt ECF transporter T component CbiQ [bacterium]
MIEEVFATGDSLMHRLDPRVRILAALAYSIPVALVSRPIPMILALVLSILITALARLQVKALFKRLIVVNSIILLFWIVVPFTFDGETIFEIGPLAATREGIIYAASVTIKSNAIFLAFLALVATMPVAAA